MEWRGEGLIIRTRRHGEGNAVVDIFTREHGRYVGLVRGGNSRRQRPTLQTGNMVTAVWRARLAEQLGVMTAESLHPYSAEVMDDDVLLTGLQGLCAHLQLTSERQAYTRLYDVVQIVLSALPERDIWLPLFVRFELALLEETGFGLDLSHCAVSGTKETLTHVSPRSGRAVSAEVAAPYIERLLPLPRFLQNLEISAPSLAPLALVPLEDVLAGLQLTGHFLERRCYAPHDLVLPPARARLIDRLKRITA